MEKFERLNKLTNTKEVYVGVTGELKTFSENAIANKGENGKKFHRFTAEVETPKGPVLIGGQCYEGLIPHLGGTPSVGDKLQFAARLEDLQNRQNAYWGISGNAVDAIDDSFLEALEGL